MNNNLKGKILSETSISKVDIDNLESINEFIVIDESEVDLYLEMIKLSQSDNINLSISRGKFTISVNGNYLICFNSFKKEIKNLFLNFIKNYTNENFFDNTENFSLNDLKHLSNICKLIIVHIPEFLTIYNIKLKILERICIYYKRTKSVDVSGTHYDATKKLNAEDSNKINLNNLNFSNLIQIIDNNDDSHPEDYFSYLFEEMKFINLINNANRKCCYSWFYRQKVLQNIFSFYETYITSQDESSGISKKENKNKIFIENKISQSDLQKLRRQINDFFESFTFLTFNKNDNRKILDIQELQEAIILLDILLMKNINDNEKRNYHLWKYIINIFSFINSKKLRIYYLYFAIECFAANNKDYSAYTFIVNFFKKFFNQENANNSKNRDKDIYGNLEDFNNEENKRLKVIVEDYLYLLYHQNYNFAKDDISNKNYQDDVHPYLKLISFLNN